MSFTAVIENDTIKLPQGLHFPNGTPVRIEPLPKTEPVSGNDPIYRLHEIAVSDEPMTDRDMDAAIYGV